MPKSDSVVELVNMFNLYNYHFDDIYTNFTVEVEGLLVYLFLVLIYKSILKKEEIIKQHYSTEEVAGKYNLNYFPFVLSDKR